MAPALRERFDAVLRDLVPEGSGVALVDWPAYGNVGDHLIFLGTVDALRRIGADLVYTADVLGYTSAGLRAAIGAEGVILLSGGGNFGDRYPLIQRVREHILLDFPGTRVIGLSQTLDFSHDVALSRAAAILNAHGDAHLLWRDEASLRGAEAAFSGVRHSLAPDCAFGLDQLSPSGRGRAGQVWVTRTDDEGGDLRLLPAAGSDATVVDWKEMATERSPSGPYRRAAIRTASRASRSPAIAGRYGRGLTRIRERVSRRRLRVGVDFLEMGEVLVTDRLHGHVLALLLEKPHVLVDTGYGKIDRFVSTWTGDSPLLRRASNSEEASAAANLLQKEMAGGQDSEQAARQGVGTRRSG